MDIHYAYSGSIEASDEKDKNEFAQMNSGAVDFYLSKERTPMRALLGLSTLGLYLATAALAQASAAQQPGVTPPGSQTEPWLQDLPARRGLEPKPKSDDEGVLTDINSATQKELLGLKDIGRTRAADIIKGRPYKDKDDLVTRKILPPEVYDEIKDAIVARQK